MFIYLIKIDMQVLANNVFLNIFYITRHQNMAICASDTLTRIFQLRYPAHLNSSTDIGHWMIRSNFPFQLLFIALFKLHYSN